MKEHRLTETDMRMALRQRGHTESQVAHLLGDIKADAWDEGYNQSDEDLSNDGFGNMQTPNPYRSEVGDA